MNCVTVTTVSYKKMVNRDDRRILSGIRQGDALSLCSCLLFSWRNWVIHLITGNVLSKHWRAMRTIRSGQRGHIKPKNQLVKWFFSINRLINLVNILKYLSSFRIESLNKHTRSEVIDKVQIRFHLGKANFFHLDTSCYFCCAHLYFHKPLLYIVHGNYLKVEYT